MACDLNRLLKLLDIDPNDVIGSEPKVKVPCPLHGGSDPNCFINTEGEGWYCHSVCQRGGKLTDLVAEYREISQEEASLLLRGTKHFSSSSYIPKEKKIRVHKSQDQKTHLPHGIALEAAYRKILPDTLSHFGVYLCTDGRFTDRVIIPLYNENGEYVGFQARRLYDHDTIGKYVFSYGTESKLILYNYNNTKLYKEQYIVEGVFGVMNFWQHGIHNVVGLVGGGFGPKRAYLLKNHDLIVCTDNDLAGENYRKKIRDAGMHIKKDIIAPLGIDFDNMSEAWFKRLIKGSKHDK